MGKSIGTYVILFFLLLSLCLFLFPDTRLKTLESRLPGASGQERLDILMELTDIYLARDPKEAFRLGREALALPKTYRDPKRQLILLNALSTASTDLGKFPAAKEYALKSLDLARITGDKKGEAGALVNLSRAHSDQGDYGQALAYCSRVEALYKETGDRKGIALTNQMLGVIYFRLSDYSTALDYTFKSRNIYEELGDRNGLALTEVDAANIYSALGEYDKALEYQSKTLRDLQELGDDVGIAKILDKMGMNHMRLGNYTEAMKYLDRALKLSRERGFKKSHSYSLNDIGEVYIKMRDYPRAQEYFKKSLEIKEEIEDQMGIAYTLLNIGGGYRQQGRYNAALPPLRRALGIASELKVKSLVRNTNKELSDVFEALNDYPKALFHYKRYKDVNDSMFNEKNSRKIAELEARYDLEKKEKEIALLKKDKQLRELDLVRQKNFKNSLIIVSFLVLLLAFLIYTRYRLKIRVTRALQEEIEQRKKAEAELLKSQKLEAVGILAGGIAHDFNNLLAVIMGNLDLVIGDTEDKPELNLKLRAAERASFQAAELAGKLLTFSKGGWISPRELTLGVLLKRTLELYPELQPLHISISIPRDLPAIYGDERQLQQVIRNLLQNAGEASENSNEIAVEAEEVKLDSENDLSLNEGKYVKISIKDRGKGIPPGHIEKIFDPYFSTKDTVTQKGMGLGLAICYSIIKKHDGHIAVYSEVGKGTAVELYLPVKG